MRARDALSRLSVRGFAHNSRTLRTKNGVSGRDWTCAGDRVNSCCAVKLPDGYEWRWTAKTAEMALRTRRSPS